MVLEPVLDCADEPERQAIADDYRVFFTSTAGLTARAGEDVTRFALFRGQLAFACVRNGPIEIYSMLSGEPSVEVCLAGAERIGQLVAQRYAHWQP